MTSGDTFDPDSIVWVLDDRALKRLLEAIETCTEVVIDLETTGLNEHETGERKEWPVSARISLASLTLPMPEGHEHAPPPTYVVPLSHPDSPWRGKWRSIIERICRWIRDADKPVVNQNLKFDMKWWHAATGIDLSHLFAWDTQISSHLLDENESTRLKDRAPATFGVTRWDDFDLSTPGASEKVPLFDLGVYAARDTYWTWKLADLHRAVLQVGEHADGEEPETADEVESLRLGRLAVWCAMPTSATLTAIEQRGIGLDRQWVDERIAADVAIADETREMLVERYSVPGDPSFAATSKFFKAWAEAAVDAGDLRVAALTPTGMPQWSKAVLIRQARAGSDVAETLLEHRRVVKELEFLRSWVDAVTPAGLIHATYNAGRVVTGRLSCSDPNMQQVSRHLKPAFVPAPGYYMAELDYSQIEMRVAAYVSRCEPMIEAFLRGDDLHVLIAADITKQALEDVTAEQRQRGKAGNFGFLFGMGAEGFRDYAANNYDVVFTEAEAQNVRQTFFETWDGMAQWHGQQVRKAVAAGQVVNPIGRVRRLPTIHDGNPKVAGHAERQAINSPVQSFASDVMQMAAASIEGNLPGHDPVPGVRLVGTVHDSILAEVPIDDWKRATGRMMRRMLDLGPVLSRMGCDFDVPLAVDAKVGTRWGRGDVGTIS